MSFRSGYAGSVPGGRSIMGCDVVALVARLAPDVDVRELSARIAPDREFPRLDELERALRPPIAGLTPGRLAALLGPLFGEFE